jgi:hypothetical protein
MSIYTIVTEVLVENGVDPKVILAVSRALDKEIAAELEKKRRRNNKYKRDQRIRDDAREPRFHDMFERTDDFEARCGDASIALAETNCQPRQECQTDIFDLKKKESISVKESDSDSKDKYSSSDATLCPANWQPSEEHHAAAAAKGLGREKVDQLAVEMRAWSQANKHKDNAYKADWSAAFHGWIARQKTSQKPTLTVVQGGRPNSSGEESWIAKWERTNPEAFNEWFIKLKSKAL